LRVQTSRATDQHEITCAPVGLWPPLNQCRPIARDFCGCAHVAGWLMAGALQPPSYSPMRQTMSVLAGQSATDRWVMTGACCWWGAVRSPLAAGLTAVRRPARILLILTGLSTLGIVATPEPATGPTSRHLAFAVSCVITTAVWPVLVARAAPAQSWLLSVYGCATVTVVFAGLSCWLLIAARGSGGDLGMVERLTATVQGLFPLVVALGLRQTARDAGSQDSPSMSVDGRAVLRLDAGPG
jgi:hypothetical protein